jgi:hypothetical protein
LEKVYQATKKAPDPPEISFLWVFQNFQSPNASLFLVVSQLLRGTLPTGRRK